jgi:hypothetical protein
MLFKALIERLLGSDEAQDWKERDRAKTSRFSYDNYPSLVGILIDLLEPDGAIKDIVEKAPETGGSPFDLHGAEGVFPALQILRQARPPGDITHIRGLVKRLLPSPHWHMRDMSARTYVSLRTTNDSYQAVSSILNDTTVSHNERHGRLLVAKYLLKKLLREPAQAAPARIPMLMRKIAKVAQDWYQSSNCPFIRSAILDLVSLCGMTMFHRADAVVTLLHHWGKLTAQVKIGPRYNLGPSDVHGDALFQTSLVQMFFIDRVIMRENALKSTLSEEYQGIDDALMLLATEDPDTCCAALETLDTILQLKASNGVTIPLSLVMASIHRVVLEATDPEVISKAQAVLADALVDKYYKTDFFNFITAEQVTLTLTRLETQCLQDPPSNMQSALHLLGFFLDYAYNNNHSSDRKEILEAFARHIKLLRMTIIDTNPFDTRIAAIQSLSALPRIFTASPRSKATSPLILGLSFILYDLLNDDDDEIRDQAARATGTLLRGQGLGSYTDTVPILTTHRLAAYLSSTFSHSGQLSQESIRRLTNTPGPTPLFRTPFAETFKQDRKEDSSLFAQEKQNLYKDDTTDAILFSRLLLSLPPSTLSPFLREGLANWVTEGLRILTQTAGQEEDGALGWSTKAEVFTLGMRVFCAAEVVMNWGGAEREGILKALSGFFDRGCQTGVHGLWIERMEGVLGREVLDALVRVKGSLPKV